MNDADTIARKTMRLERSPETASVDYLDRVDRAAKRRSGEVFLNSSLGHAIVIVERLIADAYGSVAILSRNLDPKVYGRNQILEATRRFLDEKPRKMRLLLEERNQQMLAENPFLNKFKNDPCVEIRIVPTDIEKNYKFHFLVTDGESYRFEPDKSTSSAVVAFGDTEGAKNLENFFSSLWAEGISI